MTGRVRRRLLAMLAACCLSAGLLTLPSALAEADGTRVNRALLIGVDDFVSRPSIYPASTNNVFAMQAALQASSIPFETIMIPDVPVTDEAALAELIASTFADADADDVSYLYLCTHGEYDGKQGSEPALLLSDGVKEGRLTPAALEAALNKVPGVKVILLDACYSGAFIGKGLREQPKKLCFLGDQYKVIASSGAMEESWYWNTGTSATLAAGGAFPQGAFYFSQALSQGLSPHYGFPADLNRDGSVTLSELYATLMETHAASTPQVYPQEDDFVVFQYDPAAISADDRAPIGDVTFSSAEIGAGGGLLRLEYIAMRPVRVAYQVVRQRDGVWRFDEAQLLYDNVEQYTAFGDEPGAITAGRKVRTLEVSLAQGETSGYILVQLVSIERDKLAVHAGTVVAIPPQAGELNLRVSAPQAYTAGDPRELMILVDHASPCLLSVSVVNAEGETVRRFCHKESTRPLQLHPEGSLFYWDGRDKHGKSVAAGEYRIRATGYLGGQSVTVESETITLRAGTGG